MQQSIKIVKSDFDNTNGLPQSKLKVSFAGTFVMCMIIEANAILKIIAAVVSPENPNDLSLAAKNINKTNNKFTNMVAGINGRFAAKEIAPPRITPCINM